MLRLERYAWSVLERLDQKTKEYPPPLPAVHIITDLCEYMAIYTYLLLGINPWHDTVPLDSMQRLHCNREVTVAIELLCEKLTRGDRSQLFFFGA